MLFQNILAFVLEEFLQLGIYRRHESRSSVATQTVAGDDSTLTITDYCNTWPSTEFTDVEWIDQDDDDEPSNKQQTVTLLEPNNITKSVDDDDVAL